VKWWARQRKLADPAFKCKSFIVELLVAYLADQGVDLTNHPLALEEVFGYIVKTGLAERIAFTDYHPASKIPALNGAAIEVFDPVNPANNIASRYSTLERDRIVEAADEALGAITEARYARRVRKCVHAARRYSCSSPPSRSRRCTRPGQASVRVVLSAEASGGCSASARCGRCRL
jgi:hypothetical protein